MLQYWLCSPLPGISFTHPFTMIHFMELSFLIFLLLSMALCGSSDKVFNVMEFGAVGDGVRDDSQAFLEAWNAVCTASTTSATLTIQKNTFLLRPTIFTGPCKPPQIYIQVLGDLTAPKTTSDWYGSKSTDWLTFIYINGLIINGNGTLDGQGSVWWSSQNYIKGETNELRPIALYFSFCNNLQISGINVINSPSKQVKLFNCIGATVRNLQIRAPPDSPNTDGLVIALSSQVQVLDSYIGTGDDCIAILTGSSNINITRIACSPGHGISIGSLGYQGNYDTVEEIHVQDCSFTGTQNGIRIKTWQGGSGYARKITFQRITLNAVENPIIIDQYYCPHLINCQNKTSAVEVSDVSYDEVQGTSTTKNAINLSCSQSKPCTNIQLNRINIISAVQEFETSSYCLNAHGTAGISVPNVACLEK